MSKERKLKIIKILQWICVVPFVLLWLLSWGDGDFMDKLLPDIGAVGAIIGGIIVYGVFEKIKRKINT